MLLEALLADESAWVVVDALELEDESQDATLAEPSALYA